MIRWIFCVRPSKRKENHAGAFDVFVQLWQVQETETFSTRFHKIPLVLAHILACVCEVFALTARGVLPVLNFFEYPLPPGLTGPYVARVKQL